MFIAAAAAAVVAVAVTGSVIAADGATDISVTKGSSFIPGEPSPSDAPGVTAIRAGKAIPAGYRITGQRVTNKRATLGAAAAPYFRCPGAKRLKTFMMTGDVGFSSTSNYVDHRQTWLSWSDRRPAIALPAPYGEVLDDYADQALVLVPFYAGARINNALAA
jgi:hypothetical protein